MKFLRWMARFEKTLCALGFVLHEAIEAGKWAFAECGAFQAVHEAIEAGNRAVAERSASQAGAGMVDGEGRSR